ncbi:hypothetical protein llap_8014 [Limosa lapponica baueri]|uniref:Uncharacterized protein n=1 Tax=Limosa lapponica baueri TaxID=1758121 RepID=A0A2I0U6P1_LIMLA|nr:hypothetical protein llap_8014 [Limosa lapponica baueri]
MSFLSWELLMWAKYYRAALQPIFVHGIELTHMQDPALGLVELHEFDTDSPVKLVQVPLDDILSLQPVNHSMQLGVVSKFAEGALNPNIHVTNKDVK